VTIAEPGGNLIYANPAARRLLALEDDGSLRSLSFADLFSSEDRAFASEAIFGTVAREGRWSGDFRFYDRAFERSRAVRLSAFTIGDEEASDPSAIALVAHDIGLQQRAETRLRTLVESGPSLSRSLDYLETLGNLAELVVRTLATFCVIDVFTPAPSGAIRVERIASLHADRSRQGQLRRLSDFLPSRELEYHPVARILRNGTSSLVETVDDRWIAEVTISAEHAEAVRVLGIRSYLSVPIVANGKVLGALSCAIARESRVRASLPHAYDAEDLFFFEELGRRGGIAIENALTFEHERAIASALQEASLPASLPSGGGLTLHADYRPGKAEATIGGDWYDAHVLENGSYVFTIGDVVGKGLRAAIVMTKIRQAMQAASMVDSDPNVALTVADRTLRLHDPDGIATALAARFDPVTRRLRFASAGHPAPMLRHASGRVEELNTSGLLLGMRSGASAPTRVVTMPPGAALVFYTDGLIEATRDIAEGQRRLHAALRAGAFLGARAPAKALVDEVLGRGEAGDDVAVLIAAFDQEPFANSD
jgi:hypothetical protein